MKLKTAVLITLAMWSISSFAQDIKTVMCVMKGGAVVHQSDVTAIEDITFTGVAPGNALVIGKNDNSAADKILLKDIQKLSFTDVNLTVEMVSGSKAYPFEDIVKLFFKEEINTGIQNPPAQSAVDAIVSVSPAGDATVESPAAIRSLMLFSVDGKIISKQQYSGVKTPCTVSLQNSAAGVYLLRVETTQGAVVKKIVKP